MKNTEIYEHYETTGGLSLFKFSLQSLLDGRVMVFKDRNVSPSVIGVRVTRVDDEENSGENLRSVVSIYDKRDYRDVCSWTLERAEHSGIAILTDKEDGGLGGFGVCPVFNDGIEDDFQLISFKFVPVCTEPSDKDSVVFCSKATRRRSVVGQIEKATKHFENYLTEGCARQPGPASRFLKRVEVVDPSLNDDGVTAIMHACLERDDEKLKEALVDIIARQDVYAGSDGVCLDYGDNNNGASPLYVACKLNWMLGVKLLLCYGADVNMRSYNGQSPLYAAVSNGCELPAFILLEHGAEPNECFDGNETCLHVAALNGDLNMVELLVEYGAEVNAKTDDGHTPLHYAVAAGSAECAAFLISKGADEEAKDSDGYLPFDYVPEDAWRVVESARQYRDYRRSKKEESEKNGEDEKKSSESEDEDTK